MHEGASATHFVWNRNYNYLPNMFQTREQNSCSYVGTLTLQNVVFNLIIKNVIWQ